MTNPNQHSEHFDMMQSEQAMRNSVAERAQSLSYKRIGWNVAFTAIAGVAGAALGAALGGTPMLLAGGIGGVAMSARLGISQSLTDLVLKKETSILEIDENYLRSHMRGNNHWGAYRTQVVDHYPGGHPNLPTPMSLPILGTQPGAQAYGRA